MSDILPEQPENPLMGERRFELLVNAIRDYAIYLIDCDGYVTSWNAGAQRFKGYTSDEIIGKHFSCFYTEGDRADGLPARALRTAAETGVFQSEGWRVRKDGTLFWTSIIIDAVRDENGKLIGYAKITRDLTDARLAQQQIEKSREALAQAQKLEAIGRLTGGVAHDFNNLLTVIRSSAELLRRATLTDEKRTRYIEAIASTADRAALLTRQLLAFARQQPLQPEVFGASERVRGIEQVIETTLGSPVRLVFEFAPNLDPVEADPSQFETAILNMVINARDAMPTGGVLRISSAKVETIPAVRGHAGARGEFVAVSVADNGTGIDDKTLTHIFEPFFTTKEINKGTGLGLSQVYGFAKQSGGEIDVETELGVGTTFTLYLPVAKAPAGPAPAPDADARPPVADSVNQEAKNVLLVEDNQTVGEFARGLFLELGHQVSWATDGQAALELLRERRNEFDLVFSDVVMPGISGIELGLEIRRTWPDLRIVLASGYSHVLVEQGRNGFEMLEKPYSIDALLKILAGNSHA